MKRKQGYQANEKNHFDKLAEVKGEIWWGSATPAGIKRLRRRAELVLREIRFIPDPRVLELGCGTGAFSQFLLKSFPLLRLRCCDISGKSVEAAERRCSKYRNVSFEVKDITSDPYPDAAFDFVVGNSVLHHLPVGSVLNTCFRILNPGGAILFFEPNMMNPQIAVEKNISFIGKALENSDDETAFFRWPLKKTLCSTGFESVSVQPFDFLHPAVPGMMMDIVSKIGDLIEKAPILREISGSLFIRAYKPDRTIHNVSSKKD